MEEIEDLQHALCATREEEPQYEFHAPGGDYNTKETQWTSTAPTEQSTVIGTDTGSEIISTLTTVSNLWREEMSEAMLKTREHMIDMDRNHTVAMLAMRQMTDELFSQGTTHM